MGVHCSRCGAYAKPDDLYCAACGAGLSAEARTAGTGRELYLGAGLQLPFGIGTETAATAAQVAALSALVLLVAGNVIGEAFAIPSWQVGVACVAVLALLLTIAARSGPRSLLHLSLHAAVYMAGGFTLATIAEATASPGAGPMPPWKLWIIYSGVYAALFVVLPRLLVRLTGGPRDPERFGSIADDAREAQMRSEAELLLLPSHSWYMLATWVTALTMVGSFVTTAIGLYDEVVDPHDHWIIRYGVPVGLSALASLIIWAGWNFVFLSMRVARSTVSRTVAYMVGLVLIVPLTLAISTVFGIIGVGGTAGLKAHHTWYVDVLDAYYQRAEQIRQAELRLKNVVETLRGQYQKSADAETNIGTTCGAGQGNLYQYYASQAAEAENLLEQIGKRAGVQSEIPAELKSLRSSIDSPATTFKLAQGGIAEQFKAVRPKIQNLEVGSLLSSIEIFVGNMANLAESDEYFRLWGQCQYANRGRIQAELKNALSAVRKDFNGTKEDLERLKSTAVQTFLAERSSSTIPFLDDFISLVTGRAKSGGLQGVEDIPAFVPMRPFWAVMNYAGQLPGYIALQFALDFSPAFLGLLFALLAPFPDRTTALAETAAGRWINRRATAAGTRLAGATAAEGHATAAPQPVPQAEQHAQSDAETASPPDAGGKQSDRP